jgi:hypothetical protein
MLRGDAAYYFHFLPLPLSTVSNLTQSSQGGTNQAILDVLYGDTKSSLVAGPSPILLTVNLCLCHLLVPDILHLHEKDKLVLVLSPTSHLLPLYKGVIVLQDICQSNCSLTQPSRLLLANKTLEKWHAFKHLGALYNEFPAIVVSYPKRHLLYDKAIDEATLCLWLGQEGEGFLVEFLDYPGQTTLVKWKDLQDLNALEIWRLATRHDSLPMILFGRPHSMEAKVDYFQEALGAVSGALTWTLNALLEYYKMESNMYCRHASDLIVNSTKAMTSQANTYLDELQLEIQSSVLELFAFEVDQL